jgi:hypothetical protein
MNAMLKPASNGAATPAMASNESFRLCRYGHFAEWSGNVAPHAVQTYPSSGDGAAVVTASLLKTTDFGDRPVRGG